MADSKISALPAASTILGAENLVVTQGGNTKRVSVTTLMTDKDVVLVHRTTGTPDYFMDAAGNQLSVVNAAPKAAEYITLSASSGLDAERVIKSSVSNVIFSGNPGELEIRREAVSGDIVIPANSNLATLQPNTVTASHINPSAVTNVKLASAPANTLKANATGSSAAPSDFAVNTSSLVGRGTGNLTNITVDSSLVISAGGVLSVAAGAGAGEANTASNKNIAGVGVFKQKTGVDLEFRGINAGSNKVTVTLDGTNNEIDIDVAEENMLVGGRNFPLVGRLGSVFSTGVIDNDPTAGKFKFDNATLGSVTKLWIDDLDASSRNIVSDLNTMVSGDKIFVYNATGSTLHTIFTLSSTATDKTGYKQFSGSCGGGAGSKPANGDTCVLVYVSAQMLPALLQVDNFARFQSNGSGGLNLITNTGAVVESVVNVYALPGKTISGVATLPGASTVPVGTEALLHKDNFVGTGANPVGCKVWSDGTNWRPVGHQVLFSSSFGTVASPTMTRTTTGRFALTDPIIPAGLLYAGAKIRVRPITYNVNTAATTGVGIQIYLGTDTTTYTNNTKLCSTQTSLAGNAVSMMLEPLGHFINQTTLLTSRALVRGGSGIAAGYQDPVVSTAGVNTAVDQMITIEVSTIGSATQVNLLNLEIVWEW